MKLWKVTTRNGTFITFGNSQHSAQNNFTISFPSEKIRIIEMLEDSAVMVSDIIT